MPYAQSGLQFAPIRMNSDAIAALAADTALILNTSFSTGLTQSFLVKQLQYNFQAAGLTAGDSFVIGLANGTATIGEIEDALRLLVNDPDDASSPGIAAQKNIIWWETLMVVGVPGAFTGSAGVSESHNETISIGGGKGIPAKEGTGVSIFVYNAQTIAITTGAVVDGLITLKGVWLND